jgi:excinuclease ABC subunit C
VAAPPLTLTPLEPDPVAALGALPPRPGVGQILGPGGKNLVIGRPSNLRRWAGGHLGQGRPPAKGRRPRTDLRPVARELRWTVTTSAFHQRLVYERLMAGYVKPEARRDLKPPAYLHLDLGERFPRLSVRGPDAAPQNLYGPFRDRRVAARALDALHKLFPLRPCDFTFEPAPDLALGLGCLYAQVRTCAAPCLVRVSEGDYRALAAQAQAFLSRPGERPPEVASWAPPWVAALSGSRALVVERGRDAIELYPVRDGAVLEEASTRVGEADLAGAIDRLVWPVADPPRDDRRWLSAWLHAPRRTGAYLVVDASDDAHRLAQKVAGVTDVVT